MKRIVTIFYSPSTHTVGKANRITRLKLLEDNYFLIVLTNQPEFIRKFLSKSEIVGVAYPQNIFTKYKVFWLLAAGIRLFAIKFDCLFAVFSDSPIAFFKRGRPFLCHIHQSHEIIGIGENTFEGAKGEIKKIIFKINAAILIKCVKMANFCFPVSQQLKNFFIEKGIKKERIEYLPHGVDVSLFNINNAKKSKLLGHISSEMFIMTYTGWVGEKRGIHLMLDGLLLIKRQFKNIHLVIVGADELYIKLINKYALENDLKNNITVFGRIDYSEIPNILYTTDICLSFLEVNESYSMSPPQKIFEYFVMGKPVIANKIPTHTDYISDDYNGKIIQDLEPIQFKNVIVELVNDKSKIKEMSKNSLEYSRQFNMKFIEDRLISKLDELLLKT